MVQKSVHQTCISFQEDCDSLVNLFNYDLYNLFIPFELEAVLLFAVNSFSFAFISFQQISMSVHDITVDFYIEFFVFPFNGIGFSC